MSLSEREQGVAIIGSREVTPSMRREIHETARDVLGKGLTIVTGGAWGADFEAMYIAFEEKCYTQLLVFLPQGTHAQFRYYTEKGDIEAASKLATLFDEIKKVAPSSLQTVGKRYNSKTYGRDCMKRNNLIMQHVHYCYAFQNLDSASENNPMRPSGTQIAIRLANENNVDVDLRQFRV